MKLKAFLIGIAMLLSGCVEVLSIPTVSLSSNGDLMAFLVETEGGESMSLKVLSLGTGIVGDFGKSEAMTGAFDWHPNENSLAFVEILEGVGSINVQISDMSGDSEKLMDLPENFWVNQMAYSPDAAWIALSVSILADGTDVSRVLDFSEDLNPEEIRVILLNTETGETQELANERVGDSPSLVWSPEGRRLVYAYDGHVYVYDTDEEEATEINWQEHLSLRSPSWLSEDSLVMLSAADPEGEGPTDTEIVRYNLANGGRESWVVTGNSAAPTASPDGRYIAYLEGRASAEPELSQQGYSTVTVTVMLLNLETGSIEPIYVGIALDRPVWSEDSQMLYISNGNAFAMAVDNPREIFAVEVATGTVTPLYQGDLATSSLLGWFPPQEENE
jgi:Tol biopolymer transport system component